MGTRGCLGFGVDEKEYITYNHWDSYPSGVGVNVLNWLRVNKDDLEPFIEAARNLIVIDRDDRKPTAEEKEKLRTYSNLDVSEQSEDDWYCLLKETHGNPGAILESGFLVDSSDFPYDSLFCEWGYLIDFNNNRLEVYKGFQGSPHNEGRFADMSRVYDPDYTTDKYYPVKLVATFDFDDLPTEDDFIDKLEGYKCNDCGYRNTEVPNPRGLCEDCREKVSA